LEVEEMNKPIDCTGAMCPVPVVKAQIQYKKLDIGDSITIITDHSCTYPNIRDVFKPPKCKIEVEEEGGIWEITIIKLC
jgi:tRNA 2-thiouridine synthesizing protein A